jgi:hypothetical protein
MIGCTIIPTDVLGFVERVLEWRRLFDLARAIRLAIEVNHGVFDFLLR